MKIKKSKHIDFKPYLVIIFSSLFINIYTFTSLSHLFKFILNGEIIYNFEKLTNYDDFLFLMRFLLYFTSSTLSGIIIYIYTNNALKNKELSSLKYRLILLFFMLITFSVVLHISVFEIRGTDLLISQREYYFRRIMWYIGRTLSIGLIVIYIANIQHKSKQLIQTDERINRLKIENLKSKFMQLKLKISPYLIVNTFIIIEKNILKNKETCQNILIRFSKILRSSLNENELEGVESELNILKDYIYIIKEKHPNIDLNIKSQTADYKDLNLPHFTLPILLENTLKNIMYRDSFSIIIHNNNDQLIMSINSFKLDIINSTKYFQYLSQLNERSLFITNQPLTYSIRNNEIKYIIPLISSEQAKTF